VQAWTSKGPRCVCSFENPQVLALILDDCSTVSILAPARVDQFAEDGSKIETNEGLE
jgi:hypothetical protein